MPSNSPRFSLPAVRGRGALALAAASVLALTACGSSHHGHTAAGGSRPATCPLTGLAPAGGSVPQRPALAVKVGNDPAARPQSGLDHADVVYEEPIEGGGTRLLAVFQCTGDDRVGPVRSTRWVDVQVLLALGHPAFAFAGGIDPILSLVAHSGVTDLTFTTHGADYRRSSDRQPPENLYGSTAALWRSAGSGPPPPALFDFSATAPAGSRPAVRVTLTFTGAYSVGWHWDAGTRTWRRYYGSAADVETDGTPVSAANVVIEYVKTHPGPYVEDALGHHGVRSVTTGSGRALILRDGVAITATWQRATVHDPTRFVDAKGATVALAPGQTWVELLPTSSGAVTFG